MSFSPGHVLAREQLEGIERAQDAGLELLTYEPPSSDSELARAVISIPCRDMLRTPGGLPLRDRERVIILVPRDFPFRPPRAWTAHKRFAGFPHVQWSHYLCLYVSVTTEWDASDGMYGFIDRLETWFRLAAQDQLDPVGAPLHPPVAYKQTDKLIIPRADTPRVSENSWIGLAHLRIVSDRRVDIVAWSELSDGDVPETLGAAILLSEELPFEYPTKVRNLLDLFERQGVARPSVLLTLALAARRNREDDPLYVLVGAPMRGIGGESKRKQHLTAWYIEPRMATGLRLVLTKYSDHAEIRALGREIQAIMAEWLETAEVAWATVREDRSEIVVRRDKGSPMEWFQGKRVALWGCGALGGPIAEHVVRAGVRSLVLRDCGVVAPGLLSRQPYEDNDIGSRKAEILAKKLKRIRPNDLEVHVRLDNLLDEPLEGDDWTDGADVVIDATAARAVSDKLEWRRCHVKRRAPVISVAIGHRAERGLAVIARESHTGGPADVLRRTKVELSGRPELRHFANEFWPADMRRIPFQPEPGCSAATFIGSAADASFLAASLLNLAAVDLSQCTAESAYAHVITQPHVLLEAGERRQARMQWSADIVTVDPHSSYQVRISTSAWRELLGWIERSRRTNGFSVETGGILFGERDDAARVIWVSEVSGPPPDSEASEDYFICGVEGVAEANAEKRRRSRYSVQYVGMWHTHPDNEPVPSLRDLEGMQKLVTADSPSTPKPLLMILGTNSTGGPLRIGSFVFNHSDVESKQSRFSGRVGLVSRAPSPPVSTPLAVGLALSGGGSRAIAFHLGCLRALSDRGVLDRVEVISSVSGGAVIAGIYAYGTGDFAEFDRTVVALLREGLVSPITKQMLFSPQTWVKWPEAIISGTLAAAASVLRIKPPLARRFSRTSAFEAALTSLFFGDRLLTDPRRANVDVIFNACELSTGTAFRFGNRESGNWRFGKLANNSIPVAHAVAASAAYPALLPSIDEKLTLLKDGRKKQERVLLTDGGIYDNLGVSCMEPGRSLEHGFNTYRPDYIICCDAGHGQFDGQAIPYWWPARLKRSFESIFRKAQDAARGRLHVHAAQGRLKGFVLSYLGQQDEGLPYIPPDLVRRQEVSNYPTDFSPMSTETIELLALRGEQLTRLLVARWCPDL